MKKKMLYVSHVDWNWIKQRPHFLAEGLSEVFDVKILYFFQNRNRKSLQNRETKQKNISPIFTLPLGRRIKLLRPLNKLFLKMQFCFRLSIMKPEYVFLTHPFQMDCMPKQYNGIVIYDCMDDHVALSCEFLRQEIEDNERLLLKRADIILHSSDNLRKVLIQRYGNEFEDRLHLVRNGYSGSVCSYPAKTADNNGEFTVSYIGTIGKWFNFEYLLKSLGDIEGLRYKIIGPSDVVCPESDRIEYTGTIEHDKLYDAVKDTDCLMMPFIVNDIVMSVDPVKLYEYINYNMNILCVKYPEIERFDPYVYFYEDYESFISQIKNMIKDNTVKYDDINRRSFLLESSWESRVKEIVEVFS